MKTTEETMKFLYLSAVRYPEGLRDDLVQETLYKFLRNRQMFESLNRVEGYLLVTMRNLFRDYYRKNKPYIYVDDMTSVVEMNLIGADNRAEPKLELTFVEKCIARLDKIHSEPLLLMMQGYSTEEISKKLGLKRTTVKTRIHYARKYLFQMEGIKELAGKLSAEIKPSKKQIYAYDKDTGVMVGEYPSGREASRQLGVSCGNISSVMSGRKKQTNGFIFSYEKR